MAGLIGLTAADIDIQDALGAARWEYEDKWIPHPVVRLTTTLPVAVNRPEGRTIVRARWGFDLGGGRPIGNARDDRLTESPMWKAMFGSKHCLFATSGIYEQVKTPKKQSYWFRRRDGKLIVMPGLASERGSKEGKRLCAAIVTTAPNDLFRSFHDRQVCALTADEADAWMKGGQPAQMARLLHSPANEDWEAVPVDDRIFKHGRIETEDLIPVGEPVRWTGAPPKRGSQQRTL